MTYYAMHSGAKIDLADIDNIKFNLEDIAHHLTKICRYGGALPLGVHYSVASHSMNLVSYVLSTGFGNETAKALLMHDASEAYLGDLVSGVKHECSDYKLLEKRIMDNIMAYYGIEQNLYLEHHIDDLDKRIILDEVNGLMPEKLNLYYNALPLSCRHALGIDIKADHDLYVVKNMFLIMCARLGIVDN